MKILELEKPLGDLVSATDTLTGGKLSRRRKMKAKLIELKDKLGMKDGGKVQKLQGGGEALGGGGSGLGTKTIDINTSSGRRMISRIRKIMPDASRDEIIEFGINQGVLKKAKGGEVPVKMQGGGPVLSEILGEAAKNISDADRKLMNDILGESGKTISDADRAKINRIMGSRKMQGGGKVKKYIGGGPVKSEKGKLTCRGMGAAMTGGKFKIR